MDAMKNTPLSDEDKERGYVVYEETDSAHAKARAAIETWWIDLAHEEVEKVVPKAIEYGSTDLYEIGRALGMVFGWENLSHEEATELGIYFYELGKFARWTDAIRNRRRVSDDTLHDMGVYVRMAQRNRAVGGWPFPKEDS
jgi:hypothetical protein